MSDEQTQPRRMDVAEFRRLGFVQELNRLALHPFGLALEVIVDPDGTERLGGIWDYRDDPEGITFGELTADDARRARELQRLFDERAPARNRALGYVIQPLPEENPA